MLAAVLAAPNELQPQEVPTPTPGPGEVLVKVGANTICGTDVAPYATYGTAELAANMSAALQDRSGCLLRNHGTITHGATLGLAYDRSRQLEWLCQVWLMARAVGDPILLSQDELDRVVAKFGTYGQPQSADPDR